MSVAGFGINYPDLVLSFLSVILGILAGVFRVKHRRLLTQYQAVAEDHGRLKDNFKKLTEDRDRCAGLLRQATESRERFARQFEAAAGELALFISVGKIVAEVLCTHKHGAVMTNAIRAVAKRKGVLAEFEALLSSYAGPSSPQLTKSE